MLGEELRDAPLGFDLFRLRGQDAQRLLKLRPADLPRERPAQPGLFAKDS